MIAYCHNCDSDRVLTVNAHCSDAFDASIKGKVYQGYVPNDIGIGRYGDDVTFSFCLSCGQMQGKFPLPETKIENGDIFIDTIGTV
mgnify:CR=1 FL=1